MKFYIYNPRDDEVYPPEKADDMGFVIGTDGTVLGLGESSVIAYDKYVPLLSLEDFDAGHQA